jgi:hypothetical protein
MLATLNWIGPPPGFLLVAMKEIHVAEAQVTGEEDLEDVLAAKPARPAPWTCRMMTSGPPARQGAGLRINGIVSAAPGRSSSQSRLAGSSLLARTPASGSRAASPAPRFARPEAVACLAGAPAGFFRPFAVVSSGGVAPAPAPPSASGSAPAWRRCRRPARAPGRVAGLRLACR